MTFDLDMLATALKKQKCQIFSIASFHKVDFSSLDISEARFSLCTFYDCNMSNKKMSDCFYHCSFMGTTFKNSDFTSSTVQSCSFNECDLSYANMKGVSLISNDFRMTNFSFADLSHSNLFAIPINSCNFSNAIMKDVQLFSAKNVISSNFYNVNLSPNYRVIISSAARYGEKVHTIHYFFAKFKSVVFLLNHEFKPLDYEDILKDDRLRLVVKNIDILFKDDKFGIGFHLKEFNKYILPHIKKNNMLHKSIDG